MGNRAADAFELMQVLADHYRVRTDRANLLQTLVNQSLDSDDELWLWLSRTASRLGLRLGVIDCTMSDIQAFVRQGYPIVLHPGDVADGGANEAAERWLVLVGYQFGRFDVWEIGHHVRRKSWTTRKLLRWLGGRDRQERWRCMTAQELGVSGSEDQPSISPLRRLLRLLRPDNADIIAMTIFSLVVGVLTLAAPLAVEALVNTVAFGRYLQPVVVLSVVLMVFLGFAASLRLLLAIVAELIQRRIYARVAEDLGYRLPRLDLAKLDHHYTPELVNRFLDTANIQKTLSSLLLDGLSLVVSAAVGMIVLAFYHPFLLGFDIILLALMLFAVTGLGRGAVESSLKESKSKHKLTGWFEELVRNPTAFSFHGGHRFALDRSDMLTVEYLDYRQHHFRILLRQTGFSLFTYAAALTALLGLGGWLVIRGELTLGQLVAAELIVNVVVGAFAKMGKHMEGYYDLMASADKLGSLLDLPMESGGGILQLDGVGPATLSGTELTLKAARKPILEDWSGEAAVGGLTAIVGPAGCGKSLLIDLLIGRRGSSQGQVLIDGNEIEQLNVETLRQQIGLARDVEIFAGTIAENIHLYRPNIRIIDVRDALQRVGLLDELRNLPDGLDTKLQSHGRPLSHDQCLRLMIARAIVSRPRILCIDGTLDGLSDESFEKCLAEITFQPQPWTCIIATGRGVIRQRADRIWDLTPGKVIASER